jgi:thiamine-monophosphate kinase
VRDREEQTREGSEEAFSNVSLRSEFAFIDQLRRRVNTRNTSQTQTTGIGDDAAILHQVSGRDTLVTTDLLVEDIDFHRQATNPKLLGHKALAVSLSDIAAMGSRPRWALSSIGVPIEVWNSTFVDEFYDGFFALGDRYDVTLIGGDVSRTPDKIVIDSIVLGECLTNQAVLRSGAKPGDHLFVTGRLGGAAAGLRLIERGAQLDKPVPDDDRDLIHELLLRHLSPEPRVGWGLVLGEERLATAMIDISDGLSSDLHHLCQQSNVGAVVKSVAIPLDPFVSEICGRRALDPLLLALHGGEDFELLFTVAPENVAKLPRRVDGIEITEIGEIRPATEGIRLSEGTRVWDLKPEGWEHF